MLSSPIPVLCVFIRLGFIFLFFSFSCHSLAYIFPHTISAQLWYIKFDTWIFTTVEQIEWSLAGARHRWNSTLQIVLCFVIINLCKTWPGGVRTMNCPFWHLLSQYKFFAQLWYMDFNNGEANRPMPCRHTVHRKQLYTCTPAATAVLYWSGCAQWVPSSEDETGFTHSHVSIARAKWPGLGPPEVSSDQCLSPGPHGGNTSYSTICPRQCTSQAHTTHISQAAFMARCFRSVKNVAHQVTMVFCTSNYSDILHIELQRCFSHQVTLVSIKIKVYWEVN